MAILFRHLMRWFADCTAIVAPQLDVGVLYFKTKIAGNIKPIVDEMIIMILSYNISLYGLVFLSVSSFFSLMM